MSDDLLFGDMDSELFEEFVQESVELLDDIEPTLMTLERHRSHNGKVDQEILNRIFRAFHSIKGSGSFLGLQHLVSVTHIAETLLDDLRTESYDLEEDHVTVLCDALDFSRDALAVIGAEQSDESFADRSTEVVAIIRESIDRSKAGPAAPEASGADTTPIAAQDPPPQAPAPETSEPEIIVFAQSWGDEEAKAPPAPVAPPPSVTTAAAPEPTPAPAETHEPTPAPAAAATPTDEAPASKGAAPIATPKAAPATSKAAPASPSAEPREERSAPARTTIRVDVSKLDALMNLVGELILAENAVTHHETIENLDEIEGFHKAAMHLNHVTRSLQDIAMSVRMLPIAGTFRKMQRLVRDLTHKQGKDVDLHIAGEGTEVDKNLIEGISDPLVHIMRNAIDHGIESAEERIAAGKPAQGNVRLEATHRGGEVWISISDDGKGLDPAKLVSKAVERGVIPEGRTLTDAEAYLLIFEPGFSTASVVTNVSGRGVGMDVARRNLEALNGRIDVESKIGVGTTFTLRIPLTLAIIDGMLVQVGDMRYTVPLLSIQESTTVSPGTISVLPDGRELARIRGHFLRVVRLSQLHGVRSKVDPLSGGILVAVEAGRDTFALHVDRLIGQRQTVIKALPDYLQHLPGLAGCSILSNGDISLILDLASFAEREVVFDQAS